MRNDEATEERIKRYHHEEMMLILFILSSDLSKYCDDDLICFTEIIEGRIDLLFTPDFLATLNDRLTITAETLNDFITLKDCIMNLYTGSWHKKLAESSEAMTRIKTLALRILTVLNIAYVEPKEYSDGHLNIDWT